MSGDDLNRGFPAWHARGHSISTDEAKRLAAIIGAESSERFRLEIGVAMQLTIERLLQGQFDQFAELERAVDYRRLGPSLDALGRSDTRARGAAVAFSSVIAWKFGERWQSAITSQIVRMARTLIGEAKRKPGRPEPMAVADFYAALVYIARDFGGSLALPSNEDIRETPLMIFSKKCAQLAHEIGAKVIAERCNATTPEPFAMTASEGATALASLDLLVLSSRALCDRLRSIRKETENK